MISNLEFKNYNSHYHTCYIEDRLNYLNINFDKIKQHDYYVNNNVLNKHVVEFFILNFDFFSRMKSIFGEKEKTQILTRK